MSDSTNVDVTLPIQDVPTEQTVLGAMLWSGQEAKDQGKAAEAVDVALDQLSVTHFYRPAHQAIFAAIAELVERGHPVDMVTVDAELGQRRERDRVGGVVYLHRCVAACPTAANIDYYVQIVADTAARRWLSETGTMIRQFSEDSAVDVGELLEHVQARVTEATLAVTQQDRDTSVGAFADEFFAELEHIQQHGPRNGVPTGYIDVDRLLNGLKPGQLIIVGGRPGMGKSTLGTDISRHAAIREEVPTLFLSLELSAMELNQRLYAAEARVPLRSMQRQRVLVDEDWRRLAASSAEMATAPLYLEEGTGLTVPKIAAKARQYQRKYGLGLLVVDYLQLLTPSGSAVNREQEVARMSRELKLLAKELQIPVVVAAQVNRASASRADKRPQMSELRESGSLEADADVVILVDRPENHEGRDPDDESRRGEVDLIVAKHRGGPTDVVIVAQQLHYCRFANMAVGAAGSVTAGAASGETRTGAQAQSAGTGLASEGSTSGNSSTSDTSDQAAVLPICPGCRDQVRDKHTDTGGWHVGCWKEAYDVQAEQSSPD